MLVLTVQIVGVCEVKVTVRPEEAEAETVKSAAPYCLSERAAKVMVWLDFVTAKDWVTSGAAL